MSDYVELLSPYYSKIRAGPKDMLKLRNTKIRGAINQLLDPKVEIINYGHGLPYIYLVDVMTFRRPDRPIST